MTTDLLTPDGTRAPLEVDSYETFLRTKNFASLNGVRAICCLAVIIVHLKWDLPLLRLLNLGFLGVDLFFVISGFLIVTLLIRERGRRGSVSLGKFYARRMLRISPIYYLMVFAVLLSYLAISPWRPNGLRYYAWTFPVLLTYTQDLIRVQLGMFCHCWSLAVEEQFYMVWPAVEKFAGRAARWGILGGSLVASQALNFGAFSGLITWIYGDPSANKLPFYQTTFTPILLGVLLAYLLNERRSFRVLDSVLGFRWSPYFFLAMLFGVCELAEEFDSGLPRLAVHVIMMMLLGSLVIREDHLARPVLTLPPLARLGVISYGIYLYHIPVLGLVELVLGRLHQEGIGKPFLFVIVTLGTIAVAEASYRLIEQPLLRLKERFHS